MFYIGWDKTYLEIIYQGSWSSIHANFIVGWGKAQPYLSEGALYYVYPCFYYILVPFLGELGLEVFRDI